MAPSICSLLEAKYRDVPLASLERSLPSEIHHPLYVHLINAFGYRDDWAAPLLTFVHRDPQGRPYFPKSPATPEAHRHKFLYTLTLSSGSPGVWESEGRSYRSGDFVDPILQGPLEAWGDDTLFPEPSWTLQFLSAHLDDRGCWRGQSTPLGEVSQRCLVQYFRDFDSQDLYKKGRTLFTESGLHLLEAVNRLIRNQPRMIVEPATNSPMEKFFPMFKAHFLRRLQQSSAEIGALLAASDFRDPKGMKLALSNLLVAGHLLEFYGDRRGALAHAWPAEEQALLRTSLDRLTSLMEWFLDPKTAEALAGEQRKAYHFPLLHAYHALRLNNPT